MKSQAERLNIKGVPGNLKTDDQKTTTDDYNMTIRRLEEAHQKPTDENPSTIEQAKLIVKLKVIGFLSERETIITIIIDNLKIQCSK